MKCWYCSKRKRIKDSLFCKKCENIKVKDKQSNTYVIYNKI